MTQNPEALTFTGFIGAQEDGALINDLDKSIRDIVAELNNAVLDHGGVHTAGLSVTLAFKLDGGAIEVKADVKTKMPKENRPRTIYWSTPDNRLTKKNPKQSELPFRDMNAQLPARDVVG